jgi:hypothetical protein
MVGASHYPSILDLPPSLAACLSAFHYLCLSLSLYSEHTRGYRTRNQQDQSGPSSLQSSFSSVASSKINFQQEIHQWSTSSTSNRAHEMNRCDTPTASRPILNRVFHDHDPPPPPPSEKLTKAKTNDRTTLPPSPSSPPPPPPSPSPQSKEEKKVPLKKPKDRTKNLSSFGSTDYRPPTVPSPSSFFSTKVLKNPKLKQNQQQKQDEENERVKSNKAEDLLLILPVEYTIPSLSTSSLPMIQHGVVVLQSSISLRDLVTRLREQFDLNHDFDLILSQRKKKMKKELSREEQPAAVVQVLISLPHSPPL